MKSISILFASIILLAAATAEAQEPGSGTLPEVGVTLPPDLAACVRACTAPGASTEPSSHASCNGVDETARGRISAMAGRISAIRRLVDQHSSSIADHERRIGELERQVGLLGTRTSDLEAEVGRHREAIAALRRDIASLERRYELVVRDYVDLAVRVGVLEEKFEDLQGEVSRLSTRVTALENALRPVRFGPFAGFIGAWSTDGTSYTGIPIGARLALQLTAHDSVLIDGGASFAAGTNPVSTYVRGAYARSLHPMWGIETGLGGYWLGLNDQVEAKSNLVLADVNVTFTPHRVVNIYAGPMIGAEFDQGSPAFAGGFRLGLGVLLP
jgi:hypothetical protein